jgi:hypothetical protein
MIQLQDVLARAISCTADPARGVACKVHFKEALPAGISLALGDARAKRCAGDAEEQHPPEDGAARPSPHGWLQPLLTEHSKDTTHVHCQ